MIYESHAKLVEEELKELGLLYAKEEAGQRIAGRQIIERLLDEGLITPEQLNRVCNYLADRCIKDLAEVDRCFEDTEDKEYTPEEEWEEWEDWIDDADDTDDTWTNTWITYGGRSDDTDNQDNTDTDDTDKKRS